MIQVFLYTTLGSIIRVPTPQKHLELFFFYFLHDDDVYNIEFLSAQEALVTTSLVKIS